jgi:hypothetical protein
MVFEPTIPVFKRVKTFYALDRTATVIGFDNYGDLMSLSNGVPEVRNTGRS